MSVPGSWSRHVSLLLLAAIALCASACTGESQADERQRTPHVLVVGVDGLEWDVVLRLVHEGRMPNTAELMARGTFGELETLIPTLSPIIWTSIATGKDREKHGILHFAKGDESGIRLFDSRDRRTKAIWNIVSDAGRRVHSVGWWMTWPVEPIDGVMVAQTNTVEQLDTAQGRNVWKGALREGVPHQVHPPGRRDEMFRALEACDARVDELGRSIFGEFRHELTNLDRRLWENCRWAFRADATYLEIARRLARDERADLTLVYFGSPDVVGHRFWRYMRPERFAHAPTAAQREDLGEVIEDDYAYFDRALGDLIDAHGPDTDVIVVSDHGMHGANFQARFDPDVPPRDINSGGHGDAPPGVFIAAGPDIRDGEPLEPYAIGRDDLARVGSVLDVTPTLLTLLGLPVGEDMDGVVLEGIFASPELLAARPAPIATHDTPEFLARHVELDAVDPGEEERLQQLRDLGYLGDE